VEFTIDKFGRITSSGIRKGSGQPELDRAALSMLSRANPLPPIPVSLKLDSLEMTRNIEYSLITNR
jgi:protein TonB